MSVARIHNWISLEALTASDLNAEFNNLINYLNGSSVTLAALTLTGSLTMPSVSVSGTNSSNIMTTYQEGTWTPTDQSGAGLAATWTVNHAVYRRIGALVTVQAEITYPVTANGASAVIGGLPFAIPATGRAGCWAATSSTFALAQSGTSNIALFNVSGAAQSNSSISTGTVIIYLTYSVT